MSKKASKTLTGAFVLGALILALITAAIVGSGNFLHSPLHCVMFFDSSLRGLSPGSMVSFRGVPIGRVSEIRLLGDIKSLEFSTPVFVDLNTSIQPDNPLIDAMKKKEILRHMISQGLRARLNSQSLLTGQLMIEIDMYENLANKYSSEIDTYEGYPVIPTLPSQLDAIWKSIAELPIDKLADNLLAISDRISELVQLPGLSTLPGNINMAVEDFHLAMQTLNKTLQSFSELGESVKRDAPGTLNRFGQLAGNYSRLAEKIEGVVENIKTVISPNAVTIVEINRAVRDISDAARAIRALAVMLEREPEALLKGKGVR